MSWTIERLGRVAVVTMTTNPVNAQNRAFFADLHEAFDRLERDHPESPVVLTGTGTRFSAGLDLGEHFPLFAGDPAAVASWFGDYRATNMRLFTYPRPTVAAVNGHAFAGGLITAAVCDHRVAVADGARFGLNEVPIGIPMPAVYVRMLAYAGPVVSRVGNHIEHVSIKTGCSRRAYTRCSKARSAEPRAAKIGQTPHETAPVTDLPFSCAAQQDSMEGETACLASRLARRQARSRGRGCCLMRALARRSRCRSRKAGPCWASP